MASTAIAKTLTIAAALLALETSSQAGTAGMTTPYGNRARPGVQFAYWDLFSQTQVTPSPGGTYSFFGTADGSSTLTNLSLNQTSAHIIALDSGSSAQGAGLLTAAGGTTLGPNADVYYSSTRPQNWTLNATATIDVTDIAFQIKTANIINDTVAQSLFLPTLNGTTAATYVTHAAPGGAPLFGFPTYVIEYRWTGLNIPAGTPIAITFSMTGGSSGNFTRKPVDFIALDVHSQTYGGTFAVAPATVITGTTQTATFADWNDSNQPLNYAVYRVDGSSEIEVVPPGTATAPTFTLPIGTHVVRGRITNSATQATLAGETTVTVLPPDTVNPAVKITGPNPAGGTVTGDFNITGTVKENLGIASFTVTLNGTPLTLDPGFVFTPNATTNWTVTDVSPENGPNTIVAEVVDYAGRISRATKTLNYINNRPALEGTYNALLLPSGTADNDKSGLVAVTVKATGTFTGKVTLGGVTVPVTGVINNAGGARFKPALGTTFDLIDKTEFDSYLGVLSFSVASPAGLSGLLSTAATSGSTLATFSAKATTTTVPPGFLNQTAKGLYTVAFPSKLQTPSIDADKYPQGDGFTSLTLQSNGSISFTGYLADGSKYTGSTKLRSDNTAPLYTPLYRKGGSMAGEITFDNEEDNTDLSGTNFLWVRPAQPRARLYPLGWPTGVRVDASGAKYANPASLNFGQGDADPVNGNAELVFTDGGLISTITKAVSVSSTGQVKVPASTNQTYKLSLTAGSGVFTGTIVTPGGTETYRGILLNKGLNKAGFGYFLTTPAASYGASGQSGGVSLDPGELPE